MTLVSQQHEREGSTGSSSIQQLKLIKANENTTSSVSPFMDQHKRSRSNGRSGSTDPMATLNRQLQEMAKESNSYSMKGAFVKQFKERLIVLEGLTKKCEMILTEGSSIGSAKLRRNKELEQECMERARFLDEKAEHINSREATLAHRETEVRALRS